jgi:hypothetical protein
MTFQDGSSTRADYVGGMPHGIRGGESEANYLIEPKVIAIPPSAKSRLECGEGVEG